MEKAPDAFRTISEVAEELDVPQHVLRFWETRFPQIRPMKRGGGRRYYRPDDVELLRGIRHLLYGQGYTIRGVQGQIKEKGVKFVQNVWKQDGASPRAAGEEAARVAAEPRQQVENDDESRATALVEFAGARAGHAGPVNGSFAAARPDADARATPTGASFAEGDRKRLQAALAELEECRRILQSVLKDAD